MNLTSGLSLLHFRLVDKLGEGGIGEALVAAKLLTDLYVVDRLK